MIDAFNRNMPFDQFAIEQLAGDLLPNATREQKIATGFNRNHMINFEGGAIAEEYQVEYVVDRVEATSSAFMGLTMGCARCHAHKYDPITHKEFYQFFAFFNTVPEQGLDGRTGNAAPVLPLPSPEQQARLDELDAAIETREPRARRRRRRRRCSASGRRRCRRRPRGLDVGADGLVAHYELDGSFSDISGRYPARPHGHRRSDLRCRPASDGRCRSTATPRSASATSARFDRDGPVQPRVLGEAARQPADARAPEARTTRTGAATSGGSTTSCSSASSDGPRG